MIMFCIFSIHPLLLSYNLENILNLPVLSTLHLLVSLHLLVPHLKILIFLEKVKILSQTLDDVLRSAVLDHHLLIVTSALSWIFCLYNLAHPNIELCFYLLISRHFAEFDVILDELTIPYILLSFPMMLTTSSGPILSALGLNNSLSLL